MDDEELNTEAVGIEGLNSAFPSDSHEGLTTDNSAESVDAVDPLSTYGFDADEQRLCRRRRRRQMVTVGAGVALVVVVSFVVIGASGPGSKDAAAQVQLGARTTLAAHSAALTVSGSITTNGQSIPITGSGYTNLSTGLTDATFKFSTNGITLSETELSDGTSMYMQILGNGKNDISQVLPGKTWVELPLSTNTSSGIGSGTTSIATQLRVLTQRGNTVTSLGTSTINGAAVTGYQVVITPKAMAAAAKRAQGALGPESQMVKTVLHSFEKNPPVIKVWLDANHLLVREEASLSFSTASASASSDIIMDLTDYGTPITVTIPSASDVASYRAFLAAAQAAG